MIMANDGRGTPMRHFRLLILGMAVIRLVTACTTIEPVEPEPEPAPIAIDPGIYDISGLLTAEEALERKFGELLNAGITALSPDEIDAYQDRQESRLRGALTGTELSIFRIGDYVSIRMPVQAIFSMGSADIDPAAFAALASVSMILNEFGQEVVEIASHTDGRGSADYNQELSSRRVTSLTAFLQARNIDVVRVIEIPAGAEHPVSNDGSADGRELNRRVELTLVPLRDRETEAAAKAAAAAEAG
jgi:outer membrane protein OmpA-like peptidoglycan-associated protein